MNQESYNGLEAVFIPVQDDNIVTASACIVISIQYYVDLEHPGSQCTTDVGDFDEDEGYGFNWSARATEDGFSCIGGGP